MNDNIANEAEQRDFEANCVWDGELPKSGGAIRVSTIARAVGVPSRDIVEFLWGRGITSIKTPSSKVSDDLAFWLGRFFSTGKKSLAVPVTDAEDRMVYVLASQLRQGRPAEYAVQNLVQYVKLTGGE